MLLPDLEVLAPPLCSNVIEYKLVDKHGNDMTSTHAPRRPAYQNFLFFVVLVVIVSNAPKGNGMGAKGP